MEFTFSTARLLIQTEFAPLVSVIVLIAFMKTNISFKDSINRCFLLAGIASVLLTASDSLRFVTARMSQPSIYRYISAGAGYTLRPLILYLVALIASRSKIKRTVWFSLPLILCAVISTISVLPFGRGLMFDFSQENKFIRGPFGYLSHIVCLFYAFEILFFSLKKYNHNRYEPIIVIIMELAAFTATLMENSFRYDFVLSQVLISSLIFYYFFTLTQTYKRDTLTTFLNRRSFYLELNHNKKSHMILLSMDLNNLKIFNDTQGHVAGDKALITVALEMKKAFEKHAKIYRIGGDEFIAVFKKNNIDAVEKSVKTFQQALEKTEYRVACGIAEYFPGDNIDHIINLSDERMYLNKQKIKNEESFKTIN